MRPQSVKRAEGSTSRLPAWAVAGLLLVLGPVLASAADASSAAASATASAEPATSPFEARRPRPDQRASRLRALKAWLAGRPLRRERFRELGDPADWVPRERWFRRQFDADGDDKLDETEKREGLRSLDRDKDGMLSKDEALRAAYCSDPLLVRRSDGNENGLIDDPEWVAVKAEFDRDGDGELSVAEIDSARSLRVLLASPWVLARHDANKDHHWSREEEAAAMKAADFDRNGTTSLTEASVAALEYSGGWRQFDSDKDGKLSEGETDAMFEWVEEHPQAAVDPALPATGLARPGGNFLEKYGY
ncbi:MAG: hypothetical protein HY814_11175 [Candidatus Riflebacteria bacterium]|nr:hypothetical protein [Candidatus Riflebacteria bacterium]